MISLNNTKRLLFFFVLEIFLFVNYIHSKNNLIDLKELKDGIWYFKPEQHQINKKNQYVRPTRSDFFKFLYNTS